MSASTEMKPPADPAVWRASCPTAVKIPTVGSRVYYFPQGHAEQCSSEPDFSGVTISRSCYLLQVNDVRYLVDSDTDEVFIRISLALPPQHPGPSNPNPSPAEAEEIAKAHSKFLTQSDANNGGGFSVPKACAASILPSLDFSATDTPAQMLETTDLSGNRWTFRHVYRGNPRRHLLTTGWSKFVDAKKIVSGDSLVFIRKEEELFVGIRRRRCPLSEAVAESARKVFGFVRDLKGRVAPEAVVDAVRAAEEGRPFDVDFYPGKGTPEVVVDAGTVEEARAAGPTKYAVGAAVRAKVLADDAETSSTCWLGTVTAVFDYDGTPWSGSPWRMLQVAWKDQEVVPDFRGTSPWEVEPIPATLWIDSTHATAKKPAPPRRSDSQATDATKKNAPLRDNNETFRLGLKGAAEKPSPLRLSDSLATNNNHPVIIHKLSLGRVGCTQTLFLSPRDREVVSERPSTTNTTKLFEICDGPLATAAGSTAHPWGEQATNTTKMLEPCDGSVRTVAATGGSTVPLCDNVTFSIGMQGSELGPLRQNATDSGGPPLPDSRNNVTQRHDATDSGNVAREQIRLFGVTITATGVRAGETNGKTDDTNSTT